jgi:hypothetical protein
VVLYDKAKEFELRHRSLKIGVVAATALATVLPLALFVGPASADYAPAKNDVVGVGSDTLQYMLDFMADSSPSGSAGVNSGGNHFKLINFDATADANARLAYGVDGGNGAEQTANACSPGTGTLAGTGNETTSHQNVPCVLNPTIVLRAGLSPAQRPNGSGAGFSALVDDIQAGDNSPPGSAHPEVIDYARASSAETSPTASSLDGQDIDQLEIATDTLPMLAVPTAQGGNAVALSAAQLKLIYQQATCTLTWNNAAIGGTSSDVIIPIIPQVGSGTRSFFAGQIGLTTSTIGACAEVGEENDPTAIAAATNPSGVSDANPADDAIEPMSAGRFALFQSGYFLDPSCAFDAVSAAVAPAEACTLSNTAISVSNVNLVTTANGYPATTAGTSGGALFDPTRPLYIYFRNSDFTNANGWQVGTNNNWVEALFWDSCQTGQTGCTGAVNGGPSDGPYGAPFIQGSSGQSDLAAAGVTPLVGSAENCIDITVSSTDPCG